jgi:uncharacterized protein (TIGR03086 family)
MVDAIDLGALDRATEIFLQELHLPDVADLDLPTACGDWAIKDVVNHVCGGALRYMHYLKGGMPEQISWTRTADHVGDDPRAAHANVSADLRRLFAQPDAGLIRAHHPAQTISGDELLVMRVQELAVHAWDIASAMDATATIDNDLAIYILDRGARILRILREYGRYDTETEPVDPQAPAPARLLALTGRSMP